MPRLSLCLAFAGLLLAAGATSGCEGQLGGPGPDAATTSDTFGSADDSLLVHEVQPGEDDYRVELTGIVPDTLSGRASFGRVVDGPTRQILSVVRLNTGLDFGGGFFILMPGERFPGVGTHPVATVADSLRGRVQPNGLWVAYRRGLLFDLVSTDGTVTFDAVSDTLVSGTVDVTLTGTVALPGGSPTDGVLRARGTFRAHSEGAGFIIGL